MTSPACFSLLSLHLALALHPSVALINWHLYFPKSPFPSGDVYPVDLEDLLHLFWISMCLGWQNWWHSVAHLSKTKAVSRNLGDFPQCVYCGSSCTMSVQHMFSMSDMSSNSTCEPLSAEADTWRSHPWQTIAFYFMCLMLSRAWCSLVSGQQEERRRLVTPLAPILLCNQPDPGLRSSAPLVCF